MPIGLFFLFSFFFFFSRKIAIGLKEAWGIFFDINDRNILIKKRENSIQKRLGLGAVKQRAMQAM